jgi:hypothetical protein
MEVYNRSNFVITSKGRQLFNLLVCVYLSALTVPEWFNGSSSYYILGIGPNYFFEEKYVLQ